MRQPEETLHRAIVAHLRARLPEPWLVFHPANGGGRSKAEAGVLKALGVLAGMPDLLVIGPKQTGIAADGMARNGFMVDARLIAIEVKAPPRKLKSGATSKAKPAVSDAQRDVIEQLGACGVPTLIARDLDETMDALRRIGVPLKGRTL